MAEKGEKRSTLYILYESADHFFDLKLNITVTIAACAEDDVYEMILRVFPKGKNGTQFEYIHSFHSLNEIGEWLMNNTTTQIFYLLFAPDFNLSKLCHFAQGEIESLKELGQTLSEEEGKKIMQEKIEGIRSSCTQKPAPLEV